MSEWAKTTLRAGFASRIASTMLAWFSSSEMRTVFSSVSEGITASFAFQHEAYVSAASVPTSSASSASSSRCGSNVPQMKRTEAVPAP